MRGGAVHPAGAAHPALAGAHPLRVRPHLGAERGPLRGRRGREHQARPVRQILLANLGGQRCFIEIYQKTTGLFMDLTVNGYPVLNTQLCLSNVLMVRLAYLGFTGDLVFVDRLGVDDPSYDGLGSRWSLLYLTAAEVEARTA